VRGSRRNGTKFEPLATDLRKTRHDSMCRRISHHISHHPPAFVRLVRIPKPNVDGVVVGVSVNVWNAKHHFLERMRNRYGWFALCNDRFINYEYRLLL